VLPEVDPGVVEALRKTINDLQAQLKEKPVEGSYTAEQVNDEIIKAVTAETAALKEKHAGELKDLEIKNINLDNDVNNLKKELAEIKASVEDKVASAEKEGQATASAVKEKYDKTLERKNEQIKALKEENETKIRALEDKVKMKEDLIDQLKSSGGSSLSEEKLMAMLEEKLRGMALAQGAEDAVIDPDRPQMEAVFIDPLEEKDDDVESHIKVEEDVSITKKEEMSDKVSKLKNLLGSLPSK